MKKMKYVIILIFLLLTKEKKVKNKLEDILTSKNQKKNPLKNLQENIIEIANYTYPTPENTKDYIVIPLVSTSDIHGFVSEKCSDKFCQGGGAYFSSFLSNLREEWGANLLYLNSGDNLGSYESKITEGEMMSQFLKSSECYVTAIGNHEFDYGQEYIEKKMANAKGFYLSNNVYKKGEEESETPLNGQIQVKTYTVPEHNIKIGFIGLTTIETLSTTAVDLSYVTIVDRYAQIIEDKAKELREKENVNSVVLIAHIGMACDNEKEIKTANLGLFNKDNGNECKASGELETLITKLTNKKAIDVILGGHVHLNIHYFYQGVPVVIPKKSLNYFNIAYLYFDKTTKSLLNELTQLEGPIPVCSKVYSKQRRCEDLTEGEEKGNIVEFTFHGKKIIKEPNMIAALKEYNDKVEQTGGQKLFELKGNSGEKYERVSNEENFLGNWVADIIRDKADADFSFINHGTFKTSWFPGSVTIKDFYDMFTYDDFYVSGMLTGQELKTIFENIELYSGNEYNGLYSFSGAVVTYNKDIHKVINMTFLDGLNLNLEKKYKVASNGYLLLEYGDDMKKVKDLINPTNIERYGMQDQVIKEWVKEHNEVVTVSDHFDTKNNPRLLLTSKTEENSADSSSTSSEKSGNSSSSDSSSSSGRNFTIILNGQSFLRIYSLALIILSLFSI